MTPTPVVEKTNSAVRRQVAITADQSGALPDWIEIMKTGEWSGNSNKGHLIETVASLNEYKRNYDAGLAQSQNASGEYIGLPIDFMHQEWDKAAGWMRELRVDTDNDEATLMARVEWTTAGSDALKSGEFKCISPSWYPASRGEWTDPENPDIVAHNVLVGAGLTNIPFFKSLKSLMASNSNDSNRSKEDIVYIDAKTKEKSMVLDEVRKLEASALTEEQKTFLTENKDQLTADEQAKFGLIEAPITAANTNDKPVTGLSDEDAALLASVKSGDKVVVDKEELTGLKASVASQGKVVAEYTKEKAEIEVTKHLERGAIKADSFDKWVSKVVADRDDTVELLESLNDNPAMASTQGGSTGDNVVATAAQEVEVKAQELIKAAKEDNRTLSIGDAYSQVFASNKELETRFEAETN